MNMVNIKYVVSQCDHMIIDNTITEMLGMTLKSAWDYLTFQSLQWKPNNRFSRISRLKLTFDIPQTMSAFYLLLLLFLLLLCCCLFWGRNTSLEPIPSRKWLDWQEELADKARAISSPQAKSNSIISSSAGDSWMPSDFSHGPLATPAFMRSQLSMHLLKFSSKENFLSGIWKRWVWKSKNMSVEYSWLKLPNWLQRSSQYSFSSLLTIPLKHSPLNKKK